MTALIIAGYLVGAYLLGSVSFSYVVARVFAGADLRDVGTGTVSGSGVGVAAGFWPMALAGVLDIGKGVAVVVPMAGSRPMVAALAAGIAAIGHNWSIFLRGSGGRAMSIALGSTVYMAWEGTVVLSLGLTVGKLAGVTSVGCFGAQAALPVVLGITRGWVGVVLGLAVLLPQWVKRVMGNAPPEPREARAYLYRLVFDQDPDREVPAREQA
jgi:glycerol-3-phosphate acyltransferase PlsY